MEHLLNYVPPNSGFGQSTVTAIAQTPSILFGGRHVAELANIAASGNTLSVSTSFPQPEKVRILVPSSIVSPGVGGGGQSPWASPIAFGPGAAVGNPCVLKHACVRFIDVVPERARVAVLQYLG